MLSSALIFVDSSSTDQDGDDFVVDLNSQSIKCTDSQVLRVNLQEFTMPRPCYTINAGNNVINLRYVSGGTIFTPTVRLREINVADIHAIGLALVEAIATQIFADVGVQPTPNQHIIEPPAGYTAESTGDGILQVDIVFTGPHTLTELVIFLDDSVSDSYLMLGGDARAPGDTAGSLNVDLAPDNNNAIIRLTGRYPAMLVTDPDIFIRTDLRSNNVQTSNLSAGLGNTPTACMTSNILAKIPNGFTTWITYASTGLPEFFLYLSQHQLSSFRLRLTDRKGRPLGRPRLNNALPRTSAGTGSNQSRTGSLFFNCTIKVDVMSRQHPTLLRAPPPPTVPGRPIVDPLRS